jgi:NADPH-dependent 2,4-dienoyl-CoA reductase/sulfur reductase-like enzyme
MVPHIDTLEDGSQEGAGNKSDVESRRLAESVLSCRWRRLFLELSRRVVIVGAGFAGLAAARKLASAPADILVIDRHNYNLFQPLLYQVATAGLSPADIAAPIRSLLSATNSYRGTSRCPRR